MLDAILQGPHAGQHIASVILVLFAAVYAIYALFGPPRVIVRQVLDGIPLAALIGVYAYAFDLNQHGAYSHLLGVIAGVPANVSTLLLLGAATGFSQPFLSDYSRWKALARRRFERFESDADDKDSEIAVGLSILVRIGVAALWVTLGLLVVLDRYDWLHGLQVSLGTAALAGAAIAFLQHLPQLAEAARRRSGEQTGAGGRAGLAVLATVAGIVTFVVVLALFIFAASHLGWSVLVYLLLFGLITALYKGVQRIVTPLPRPALTVIVVILLLIAGGLWLAAGA